MRARAIAVAMCAIALASAAACNALTGSGDFSTTDDCPSCVALCTSQGGDVDGCVRAHCASACASSGDSSVDTRVEDDAHDAADAPVETFADVPTDSFVEADGDAAPKDGDAGCSTGAVAPVDATCVSTRGPAMVKVVSGTTFCIDKTEVTKNQYSAFLADRSGGVDTCDQPLFCAWNTTYAPSTITGSDGDAPQDWVDWCDAFMFCLWSGKHLCSQSGGVEVAPANLSTTNDQWWTGCSGGLPSNAYPYGATHASGVCNDAPSSGPVDVATKTGCRGTTAPFDGIFDMSGNIAEWQFACTPSEAGDPSTDLCQRRGGNWVSAATDSACSTLSAHPRSSATNGGGFRCCAL